MIETQDDPIIRSSEGSQLEDRKVTMTLAVPWTLDRSERSRLGSAWAASY